MIIIIFWPAIRTATAAAWHLLASTAGVATFSGLTVAAALAYGAWALSRPAGPQDPR